MGHALLSPPKKGGLRIQEAMVMSYVDPIRLGICKERALPQETVENRKGGPVSEVSGNVRHKLPLVRAENIAARG